MKIYMSEKDVGRVDIFIGGNELMVDDYVELRSLEQLKQEVRREFAEELKNRIYVPKQPDCSNPRTMFCESVFWHINDLLKQYEVE